MISCWQWTVSLALLAACNPSQPSPKQVGYQIRIDGWSEGGTYWKPQGDAHGTAVMSRNAVDDLAECAFKDVRILQLHPGDIHGGQTVMFVPGKTMPKEQLACLRRKFPTDAKIEGPGDLDDLFEAMKS